MIYDYDNDNDSIFSRISCDSEFLSELDTFASQSGIKTVSATILPETQSVEVEDPIPIQLDLPVKKKRGRPKKVKKPINCPACRFQICNTQKLKTHMSSSNCAKRIRQNEGINVSPPHEVIGGTLKKCIAQLQEHQRVNASEKKIRY